MPSRDLVIAVLAAGASRRLGRAKQLVSLGGEPLLRRQCRCALESQVGEVVAILGFNAAHHQAVIADMPIDIRVNDDWADGLATTLHCAVRAARKSAAALLVLPCDHYRIASQDLRTLADRWRRTPSKACVSRAGGYAGPPAILPTHYHGHVLELRGDVGARSVLYGSRVPHPNEVVNPRASFDLDSPEDIQVAEAWLARRSA